jgi:Ca2+-binding RTX toxin-like protein
MAAPASAQVAGSDLALTIGSRSDSVQVGDDLVQSVTATNGGPEEATEVVLTITLQEGLVVQKVDGFPGPCDLRGRIVCALPSLPAGGSARIDLLLGAARPGPWLTTATVDAAQEDPLPGNEQASVSVEVSGAACERIGTVDADRLRPANGGGAICGLGGDDVLLGSPRADDLLGGSGNDALVGDEGKDRLDGGEGFDSCTGDPGPGPERDCEARVFALEGEMPLTGLGPATVGY